MPFGIPSEDFRGGFGLDEKSALVTAIALTAKEAEFLAGLVDTHLYNKRCALGKVLADPEFYIDDPDDLRAKIRFARGVLSKLRVGKKEE